METRRRQYTAEFKRDAVALVMEQGYTMTMAAQNLGITAKLLSRWKREQQQHQDGAFPGQGHQTPEQIWGQFACFLICGRRDSVRALPPPVNGVIA